MISAIIFDMNGVLADDEALHEQAMREAFEPFGFTLAHDEYTKWCLGRSDVAGMQLVADAHQVSQSEIQSIYTTKIEKYFELISDGLPLYQGAAELVRALSAHYLLALTTGATRKEVEEALRQWNLGKYFSALVTVEEVSNSKPHPEPYLLTAKKLGVSAQECVVIEDAPNGVHSAKAAGMKCIAVCSSVPHEALTDADRIVASIRDVSPDLIRAL